MSECGPGDLSCSTTKYGLQELFVSCPNHAKVCAAAGKMAEALRRVVKDYPWGNKAMPLVHAALRSAGLLEDDDAD